MDYDCRVIDICAISVTIYERSQAQNLPSVVVILSPVLV
jgi:hypothetical protein